MSTVTQIKLALASLLGQLKHVDVVEIDNYWPPIETTEIALVIPPFGQQTKLERITSDGGRWKAAETTVMQSHRIHCAFWVKIDTAHLARTLALASEIGLEAIQLLMMNQTLNGAVQRVGSYGMGDSSWAIECETIDTPIDAGGVPYIVCIVSVPVIDYASIA